MSNAQSSNRVGLQIFAKAQVFIEMASFVLEENHKIYIMPPNLFLNYGYIYQGYVKDVFEDFSCMLKRLVCFIFIGVAATAMAQIDIPRKSIEIGGTEENKVETSILVSPEPALEAITSGTISIKSRVKLSDPMEADIKKNIRFNRGNEFAQKDYTALTNKLNKAYATTDRPIKPEYLVNQYLGDFKSGSKFVKFLYRDHEYVDGDRVRVYINDQVIHPNILLTGEFEGFYIDLEKGFNKIDIEALNQGESGPNTAQFVMYDDNKQVISSNIWNLATGVKATVIIVKD
ncbi:MAG: hypothetical protein ABNH00_11115 [Dokdonia sp.]|jgi:hypothetical protein